MATGYCDRCQREVMATRGEFNVCLMIFLTMFTGIGGIIYLIIYFAQPEDECVICRAKVSPVPVRTTYNVYTPAQNQPPANYRPIQNIKMQQNEPVPIQPVQKRVCPFCAAEVPTDAKYCSNCASPIN